MKLSVITPTEDRPFFLKKLHTLLINQTHTDWEWLIYDTSLRPQTFSDKRIFYIHDPNIVSVGEKRNRLIEKATGAGIVHCDDDDFYAENYLETVQGALEDVDFFNIHCWLSYQLASRQFYYWDTEIEEETHFLVDPLTEMQVREIHFGPYFGSEKEHINTKGQKGYGFSYAYKKDVWQKNPFPDKDLGEDWDFYGAMEKNGFKVLSIKDEQALVVHILHSANLSRIYPQYRIPHFLLREKIPHFFDYLKNFEDEN